MEAALVFFIWNGIQFKAEAEEKIKTKTEDKFKAEIEDKFKAEIQEKAEKVLNLAKDSPPFP